MLASALFGFAALLAAPQTAYAVDKEIFSRTLTTAPQSATSTTVFGFGFFEGNQHGSLGTNAQRTIAEISAPGEGTRRVSQLVHRNPTNELLLGFTAAGFGHRNLLDIEDFRARLTLEVGTTSYAGSSATYSSTNRNFAWATTGVTWADMQTYSVSLTLSVPGIDSIAFNSADADNTFYTGDAVTATVTFDEAVDVDTTGGTPQLTIKVGSSDKVLDYSSGSGTTALVFTGYTVAAGDEDTDGISIDANKLDLDGGTIKATADGNPNAVLDHDAVAASASHKVSGTTAPPGPTVSSIAFNSAGTDGAFMTGDAVTATVTFDESVTVDTTDGTPQLTIKMGGTDKVLDYSSGSPGTALVFSGYTVAANDEDTDGLSIEANKLDANGGTIQKTADTSVAAVLTHAAVAASANHKVDGVKPTLVTTGDDAPKTSLDGSKIILVFSEAIGGVDRTKITVKKGTTTETTTAESINGTKVEITLTTALTSTDTNITVALAADAVADVPGNGIAAVSATSVTRTLPPGKPALTLAAKDQSIDATVVFTAHGTSDITKYQYRTKTTGSYGSWTDSTDDVSNTGGTFTIGGLTNGTEYTVQVRGVNSDGEGAESDAKAATPNAPPAVSSVAITSTPATANTYIIGEDIVVTVTFDKNITLSGTGADPFIALNIGTEELSPGCEVGTAPTKDLVCTRTVYESLEDTDGVSVGANSLSELGIRIVGPLGQYADLSFSAIDADSNHKVDGIKPTLSRADADPNDLTKIILTFSEAIGTIDDTKITVEKGMTGESIDSVAIDSTDATKVVVTLDTALLSTDTNITVDLAADAVTDVPGNGIAEVLGTSVSLEDNVAPTLTGAQTRVANSMRLVFSEDLVQTSRPNKSAFTVKIEDEVRTVTSVALSSTNQNQVALDFSTPALRPGETVTVSYAKPSSNPLKDASDNEVESFTDQTVTNTLAATAPDAPGNLVATATHADKVAVTWDTPWDNGSAITRFEYRSVAGNSVPASTAWTAVPDSGPTTTGFALVTLAPGTEYAVEIRAVNGEGGGDEAAATATTLTPTWSFGFYPVISGADKLTEGGASRTARLIIINDVRFAADQTITLKWGDDEIDSGLIQGANGSATFAIDAGDRQGELEISAPDRPGDLYRPPESRLLTANLGGEQVGPSIALEFVDDEAKPVLSISLSRSGLFTESLSRMTIVENGAAFVQGTLSRGYEHPDHTVELPIEMTGSLNRFANASASFRTIDGKQIHHLIFVASTGEQLASSIRAADGSTAGDHSEHVFTLLPNDLYTIGSPSSATLTILDNDAAPAPPRNLRAQSRDGSVVLTWDAPTSLATTEFTAYELRHVAGSSPGGTFADISTDPETGSHTVTGLTNGTEYTFELRAKNSFGSSSPVSVSKTPNVGVAVSFGAATLSVDEGEDAVVTLTLDEAPAAGTTVTVPIVATGPVDTGVFLVPTQAVFAADETSKSFTMHTQQDQHDRPDWVLTLSLGPLPEGYVPGTHETFVLTVLDDDHPIVSATFGRATAEVQEGTSVPVTVSLSQAPEREVVLSIRAARGANLSADEFSGVPADVTFAADEDSKSVTVTFADDPVVEGNETLTLTFGTLPFRVDSSGENPQLVLTVTDDDGPPAAPDVTVQTGDGYAALSWQPVANDSPVLRYEVRWRESDGGTFNAWQRVGLVTSYRVEGLENGKAHEFEVRAVNAHGNGEEASSPGTPTARLTGIPKAPQWLRFADVTDSSRAELKWGSPSNGTDRVTANSASATFSQIQGYRIEVCRTTCGDEANWYAVVPNTRAFVHKYVHQVLAPGVIRENRYRVRAININGKTGPWSNVATLDPTRLERFWLVSPNSSTVDVHLEVWNPDGNPLYVRYTGGGEVRYAQQRLTKKGFPVIGLPVEASTHYRVEVDFVDTFDSPRLQSATVWSLQEGADPYTSPYAKDLLEAEVWRGGQWREAPDNELYLRMGETGKYRVRLKPCGSIYSVIPRRIQAPAGRLRASPTDFEPSLFSNLNCKVVQDGWRTDEAGELRHPGRYLRHDQLPGPGGRPHPHLCGHAERLARGDGHGAGAGGLRRGRAGGRAAERALRGGLQPRGLLRLGGSEVGAGLGGHGAGADLAGPPGGCGAAGAGRCDDRLGHPRHELGRGARRVTLPGGVALRPALQQSGEHGPEPCVGDEQDAAAGRVGARSDHGAGAGLQQQRGERVVGRADVGQPSADAERARHGGERG